MNQFSRTNPPSQSAFPVARSGYPFIFASAFITAVLALLGFAVPALTTLAATLFICYFFRDPERFTPDTVGAVVSPADGKVILVQTVDDAPYYDGTCLKISIFMSVFNVHVNRVVYDGQVKKISYNPGKFFSANLDKASKDNEQNAILIETEQGRQLCMVQIAGLIARRIICYLNEGDQLIRGERFGLICFGSRLDVYLSADTKIAVSIGEKVKAGTSILGYLT